MEGIASELVSAKFLIVYAYLGCVLYAHFRGKERLRLDRQILDHSGIFSPLNSIFFLFSAVPKDPILRAKDFPQLSVLRENWEVIRDEAVALFDEGKIQYGPKHNDLTFLAFKKRGWKRFHMKWYGDFLPSAQKHCPRTIELLRGIPDLNAAAFTLLPPGAELGRHRDPFATSMRYHLGLVTPKSEGCSIWVDGEKYTWKEGEDIVFDETYIHWAKNETEEDRIILFVDFTRPLHTRVVRAFNQFLIDHVWPMTASHNEEKESRGLANRLTPIFMHLKTFFRGIKDRCNRKAYYTVKYALLGSAFYFLFLRGQFA